MQTQRILGIDLGGCMGGTSAYVFLEADGDGVRLVDAFKEPRHRDHESCLEFLADACGRHDVEAIAIDAPLGIPLALKDPEAPQLPREGSGEILNPYLYRYTDYWIFRRFGLRPMPPAGDRIGRLTARAVALLHRLDYRFPEVRLRDRRVPLFEVYPRQIALTLGLEGYKQHPEPLFRTLGIAPEPFDEHLCDALLCAYGARRILSGHTVEPPEAVRDEGWCFPVL